LLFLLYLVQLFLKIKRNILCDKHKLEIVAYCNDEDVLLCGACIFDHKNHDSYLLTDPKVIEIADKKIEKMRENEQEIIKIKKRLKKCGD